MTFFNPAYWCVVTADKETKDVTGYVSRVLVQQGPFEYWALFGKRAVRKIQDLDLPKFTQRINESGLNRVGIVVYTNDYTAAREPRKDNIDYLESIVEQVKNMNIGETSDRIEQKINPPKPQDTTAWLMRPDPEHPTWTITEFFDNDKSKLEKLAAGAG